MALCSACAILVEGIIRNISVKLSGSGDVILRYFLTRTLATLLSSAAEPVDGIMRNILVEGIMRNLSVKLFEIWTSGSGDVV